MLQIKNCLTNVPLLTPFGGHSPAAVGPGGVSLRHAHHLVHLGLAGSVWRFHFHPKEWLGSKWFSSQPRLGGRSAKLRPPWYSRIGWSLIPSIPLPIMDSSIGSNGILPVHQWPGCWWQRCIRELPASAAANFPTAAANVSAADALKADSWDNPARSSTS